MIIKIKYSILCVALSLILITGYSQTYVIPDNNLKQCIIDKDPTLINNNGDLIIANAADATGTFYCAGDNVSNLDGLQFFSGISELNISHNPLTEINAISPLTQLEILKLDNCELNTLPSLRNFSALQHLDVYNNSLNRLPELPENSQLRILNASQNFLNEYPDLSQQDALEFINFSRNGEIKTIVPYNNLTAVKEFIIYICGLTQFPDVSMMTQLEKLDVGYNNLSSIPDLSANQNLVTLYANNNALVSFENLNTINTLEKVRLYNNFLSFEDFEKLSVVPNYSDIYKFIPQNEFPFSLKNSYYEADSISLKTQVANTAKNVTYKWFKNGDLFWEANSDTLNIPYANFEDSGDYYFEVSSTDFPELTIQSSAAHLEVVDCINEEGFNIETIGATCKKSGTLEITANNQPQTNLTYRLESTVSDKIFYSETGIFNNLNTPEFILFAEIGRCKKEIETIHLPIESCDEAYFTPNGDGMDDTFYFQDEGTAEIYNKWGQKIQELKIPTEWDGVVKNNGIISPGYYTVEINNGEKVFHLSVVY